MKRRTCGTLALLGLCLAGGSASSQGLGRTSFADRVTGLRLYLPPRWVTQARTALPGLLGSFRHPLGGRLLLSAQPRRGDDTPRDLATQQARLLGRQRWTVLPLAPCQIGPVAAVLLEATDAAKKTKVFQVYAIHDKHTILFTLSVPTAHSPRLLTDLRFLMKTARFAR